MAQSTNLDTLGSVEVTAAAAARIAHNTAEDLLSTRTLDLKGRRNLVQVLERCIEGVQKEDAMAPQMLQSIGNSIVSAASDLMLGIREIGTDDSCKKVPPLDVVKSDDLHYNTDIGTDVMMEIPEEEIMVRKCNVRDHTIERAAYQVPMLVEIVKAFGREVMEKFVDGETMNFTSKHGMVMKNFMTRLTGEQPWTVDLGEEANITLPRGFCPTGTCGEEVGVTAYRWPHLTYCHPKSEEKMAPDTRVIAMDLMTKSLAEIVVKKLENPIVIYIPRTPSRNGNVPLPVPEKVNAAKARSTILPVVYSNFNVS
ncbi:uncharacterized protein, partial [Penaeus vannamei]|uniref:uncharacterized protein n=1 Tax=Penaeus vannamei TaxID=6689 RepID=UPI00387F7C84